MTEVEWKWSGIMHPEWKKNGTRVDKWKWNSTVEVQLKEVTLTSYHTANIHFSLKMYCCTQRE